MRGREADPHVRVNARHAVQQVAEAQAAEPRTVNGLKASAELLLLLRRAATTTEVLLRQVSVAVDVLTQQGHLLHTLRAHRQTHTHTESGGIT